jgi:type II secretory pathway pseudopilin PulG
MRILAMIKLTISKANLAKSRQIAGFSILELLVVTLIGLILTTAAVIGLGGVRRNIKTVNAANVVASLLQQARRSAISSRTPYRVRLQRRLTDNQDNIISIDVYNRTKDNYDLLRQEYLPRDVAIARPNNVALPTAGLRPAEDSFRSTTFASNDTVTVFFNIDGSVTAGDFFPRPAANPFSGSFFVADPPAINANTPTKSLGLVRVVSFDSSTGGVKIWSYDGTKFITGLRN